MTPAEERQARLEEAAARLASKSGFDRELILGRAKRLSEQARGNRLGAVDTDALRARRGRPRPSLSSRALDAAGARLEDAERRGVHGARDLRARFEALRDKRP